jgi:hypothetical protein
MDNSSYEPPTAHHHLIKRNRIPISCFPCRISKQKCDRAKPCTQCLRKGHPDNCRYADRPEKIRAGGVRGQAKGMAARLEKLEGMVRTMIEAKGSSEASPESSGDTTGAGSDQERSASFATTESNAPEAEDDEVGDVARVVQGERTTNYVGPTHIMAILEDVSCVV